MNSKNLLFSLLITLILFVLIFCMIMPMPVTRQTNEPDIIKNGRYYFD